jgi:hypothetical protein
MEPRAKQRHYHKAITPALPYALLFLSFFICGTAVWTQGLTLLKQVLYGLSHSTSLSFCIGNIWDRVSWAICLGWLWTTILLISVSWVARIIGVSQQHLALRQF